MQVLRHNKVEPDLANIREADVLLQLPESERAAWQTLWRDVDSLIAQAQQPWLEAVKPARDANPSAP